jgi:hypothetical protein
MFLITYTWEDHFKQDIDKTRKMQKIMETRRPQKRYLFRSKQVEVALFNLSWELVQLSSIALLHDAKSTKTAKVP